MKKIMFILCAMMSMISCAAQPDGIIIIGKVSDAPMVYLQSYSGATLDSCKVKDNTFSFTYNAKKYSLKDESQMLVATTSNSRDRNVERKSTYFVIDVAEPLNINIDLDKDAVSGGALNAKLNDFFATYNAIEKRADELKAKAQGASEEEMAAIEAEYNALNDKFDSTVKTSYEANKNNIFGGFLLGSFLYYEMDAEELEKALDPALVKYNDDVLKGARRMLESLALRKPGKPFTDFSMADKDGKEHKLSEWIGKGTEGNYVLIDFWASWCGPCRREMPNVVENYKKYHDKGFEVIGISLDKDREKWLQAVESLGLSWIHLSDLKYWNCAGAELYGIKSIPASVLVGPDGKIIANDLRGPQLGEKLKSLYGF